MKSIVCLLLFSFSLNAFALQQYESSDFNIISQKIQELGQQHGADQVLVVYDLDNTLLAMTIDIGSDQWFDWQSELLKDPSSPYLVAKDFDGLLKVQGILYTLGHMRLTQSDLPGIYSDLSQKGFQQILLTSRGPDFRDATEKELVANRLPVWNLASPQALNYELPYSPNDLAKSCLTEEDRTHFRLSTPRFVSTGKNIILSAGQHKGMILKTWLCKMKKSYKAIVFADDKISNINNMAAAFGTSKTTELVTFRYTKEDARIDDFFKGDKRQAIDSWNNLLPVLRSIFGGY